MSTPARRSFLVRLLLIAVVVSVASEPTRLLAQALPGFTYSYIISDAELTDYQSLNQAQIQQFLEQKGSPLATYVDPITRLRAAQVVYTAAQDFQISPQVLLALLQKEQSLIEDPSPTPAQFDWATGYAVCDGCSTNDPALQKFRGFYNQVYNAAKRIRTVYLPALEARGVTDSGFGPGVLSSIDGVGVTPANRATAVLFTYTPHLHGNLVFSQVWQRYFTRAYPDGALLQVAGAAEVWRIQDGVRRRFANPSVLLSYLNESDYVVTLNQSELNKYPAGLEIKFPNYAFLRIPSGTVYLLVDDTLRGFTSPEALRRVGVNPAEITAVQSADLSGYTDGIPINEQSVYPLGQLIQDRASGGVFWVQDGVKHPIWSREILRVNFGRRRLSLSDAKSLEQYPDGEPVLFRDGTLVRGQSDAAVFLISHGRRRAIPSQEVFLSLGFDFKYVVTTSDAAILAHGLGEPLAAPQ